MDMKVKFNLVKEIKPKESILVSGLPGIAYIGKLSVDYLIKELEAEIIGEVYSQFFPPYVLITNDGLVELLRNEIHYVNVDKKDIFFFTGNTQAASPEGQYILADEVLSKLVDFNVKRVYSIAAFLTDRHFENPRVFGTATNQKLIKEIKEYGVIPMDKGMISGTNGLIFGLAGIKKLEGVCLLGETLGYRTATGQYLADSKAVRTVLEVLTDILGIKVDMEPLDRETERMDELITRMAEIEGRVRRETKESQEKGRTRYIT